jgi:hypothetical protein
MNYRAASIPATMVVAFAITLAVALWRQAPKGAPEAYASAEMTPPTSGRSVHAAPVRAVEPRPSEATPAPAAATAGGASSAAGARAGGPYPSDAAETEVPAILMMRPGNLHQSVDVMNRSSETLAVTVTAVNPSTGEQTSVQASVDPHHRRNLSDGGLIVDAGMQITIHSPPYKDYVVEAR